MSIVMAPGAIIEGRFRVDGLCSGTGGMGTVVFVTDMVQGTGPRLVLKYCKALDPNQIERFRREIRVLTEFAGNNRVVQIVASNASHDPPYYVMPFFSDGDLTRRQSDIANDSTLQERLFCEAIDCVNELHAKGVFHRDIKPQNFLLRGDNVLVSDMGLSTEVDSTLTTFTSTAEAWGTIGYLPPEYRTNGFRDADAAGDVFMFGKTFYHLITGRDPVYMTSTGIAPGLFHVIDRACALDKSRRFQSLSEFKQALVAAYDIILNRVDGLNSCRSALSAIMSRLATSKQYVIDDVSQFIDATLALHNDDQDVIFMSLEPSFFLVLSQSPFDAKRSAFISAYSEMTRRATYGWSFAETIADCMGAIFRASNVPPIERASSIGVAIGAAHAQNRFAAMSTCTDLITSINDDDLAQHVRPVLLSYPSSFVANIEIVNCQNDLIARTVRELKAAI